VCLVGEGGLTSDQLLAAERPFFVGRRSLTRLAGKSYRRKPLTQAELAADPTVLSVRVLEPPLAGLLTSTAPFGLDRFVEPVARALAHVAVRFSRSNGYFVHGKSGSVRQLVAIAARMSEFLLAAPASLSKIFLEWTAELAAELEREGPAGAKHLWDEDAAAAATATVAAAAVTASAASASTSVVAAAPATPAPGAAPSKAMMEGIVESVCTLAQSPQADVRAAAGTWRLLSFPALVCASSPGLRFQPSSPGLRF
jgi:hypothetical protein